jgi:hypothetical protein
MITDLDALFERSVIRRKRRHGYNIKCSRGLWEVWAPTQETAEQMAKHYFVQYLEDGEYEEASAATDDRDSEDDRDPECVKQWPECFSGGYDPRCCRFPKSCSCCQRCHEA